MANIYTSAQQLVGNTPLLQLNNIMQKETPLHNGITSLLFVTSQLYLSFVTLPSPSIGICSPRYTGSGRNNTYKKSFTRANNSLISRID